MPICTTSENHNSISGSATSLKKPDQSCPIGERKKLRANGEPGFIRIDMVHQDDQDKQKGVYHINAVDEVTQFEVACTVERISEQYLMPATSQLLECFPFFIKASIQIMARNTLTTKWLRCSKNC